MKTTNSSGGQKPILDRDKVRKQFESEYLGNNKETARCDEHGYYVLPSIQDAWSGWLAASNFYINL